MNILGLIAHAGLLIHIGHDVEAIAGNLIQHKEKFPTAAEFETLLGDAIEFLSAGLIALPADVNKTITDSLSSVKDQVSKLAA